MLSVLNHRSTASRRFFLVGCPRSGTTLLQSLLASHPQIASFPESNFFNHLFSHSEPKRRLVGLVSRRAKPRLANFFQESGHTVQSPAPYSLFPHQLTHYFANTLDQLTCYQGKAIWVEKTPTHLYHLDFIKRHIQQPKFIHIIRDGKDTVASLYDVRKKYPKQWPTEPASVDLSVNRWLKDVSISLQYVDDPAHFIVRYESLVANPEAILKPLCRFIGVDYLPDMLSRYAATAQLVSLSREPWKAGVAAPIRNANATKFYCLFSQAEQASILERTSAIALETMLLPT